MLILTRKEGQRIEIKTEDGQRIVLTMVEITAGRIRLGIDAPKEVSILRDDAKKRVA